jgi:hypothetical protein
MTLPFKVLLPLLIAGPMFGGSLVAQQPDTLSIPFEVTGRVVAIPEQQPLRDVPITLLELTLGTQTDSTGYFALRGRARVGCYHLRVAAANRQTSYWRLHFVADSVSITFAPLPLFPAKSPPDSILTGRCEPGDRMEVMR